MSRRLRRVVSSMTNPSVISKVTSKVRVAVDAIVETFDAGLHRMDIDEQLPPNVVRHGNRYLVRVTNRADQRYPR